MFLLAYLLAYSLGIGFLALRCRPDDHSLLLMPIGGMITGAPALDEALIARVLLGGAIILVGLWIVVRVALTPASSAAAGR
jgi:hypothetical protein